MDIVDNPRDLRQYFRSTYVGVPGRTCVIPYYIQEAHVRDDGEHEFRAVRYSIGKRKGEVVTWSFQKIVDKCILAPPAAGNISTKTSLTYVTTNPVRQFRKGLDERRIRLHGFHSSEECKEWDTHRLVGVVYYMYNNTYFSLRELLNMLREGVRLGGALDTRFGLILKPNVDGAILTYKDKQCGVVSWTGSIQIFPNFGKYVDHVGRSIGEDVVVWN